MRSFITITKLDINGFGRIGRMAFHAAAVNFDNDIQVAGTDDPLSADYLAHMLEYDPMHGRSGGEVAVEDGVPVINGNKVRLTIEMNSANLKWNEVDVDAAVKSTGSFLTDGTACKHIQAGAKKAIMSTPSRDTTLMLVYGVNRTTYAGQGIISSVSCITSCLASIAKVLNDRFGIVKGLMTTVHAAIVTQKTIDDSSKKDWRGNRGILEDIIPSSTGAAKAVGKVLPTSNGKLTGVVFHVPTPDASVVDLTVIPEKEASMADICVAMKGASGDELEGVLGYTEGAIVSIDFRGYVNASVFDAKVGISLDSNFARIVSWYNNEWGYSNRAREMAHIIAGK